MSALQNDLLLEKLSVATSNLKNNGINPMPDVNDLIVPFCESLEQVLRKGLKRGIALFGLTGCDYWNCISGLTTSSKVHSGIPATVNHLVSIVKQADKVQSSQGRGRLFIKLALVKGALLSTLECLLLNVKYLRYWYNDTALLTNRISTECIVSILTSLKDIKFTLKLSVCSFLHETWLLPETRRVEMIPTSIIGMTICTVQGKCMVANVLRGSIAEEHNIVAGDCLDEMYGHYVDEGLSGRVTQLHKANKGKPLNALIIKGKFKDGRWFPPLQKRANMMDIKEAKKVADIESQPNTRVNNERNGLSTDSSYEIFYVASVDVGKDGRATVIQDAIRKARKDNIQGRPFKIKLDERDIIVDPQDDAEHFGRYSYTETSSCGMGDNAPEYFGFVTGETSCSIAESFVCHVFRAKDAVTAHEIITAIGKGFNRTLCCV